MAVKFEENQSLLRFQYENKINFKNACGRSPNLIDWYRENEILST